MKTGIINRSTFVKHLFKDRYFLFLMLIPFCYYLIFHYIPMYGVIMAFQNFSIGKGVFGSDWVGLKWFIEFFNSFYFLRLIRNTILLNIYSILWGFPIPIIFALILNELRDGLYKRVVQTISYLPYFISIVVVVGILVNFLSPNSGIVNVILNKLGHESINFMSDKSWFRTIYISSGVWQYFGFSSIIYLAAISGIDVELYDALYVDGGNRLQKIIHITIPGILPTIIILLLLQMGSIMSIGIEKLLIMYNPTTYEVSDVISTYVYRRGIIEGNYSFASAVGLFNSVINFSLLIVFNKISRKVTDISLW